MSTESHEREKAIFVAALRLPEGEREAYLASMCGEDARLLAKLRSLTRIHDAAGDFLNTPMPVLLGGLVNTRARLCTGDLLKERYCVERLIAESGFATVDLASDRALADRPVVIKLLNKICRDDVLDAALQSELLSLSHLQHPNVVGIFDVGRLEDETPYLVLLYVPGVTLRELLRSGSLPLEQARTIIKEIGRALIAAHKADILHLDLKPENVIVSGVGTDDERITVIDFGIARLRDRLGESLSAGSPQYMAPDQRERPTTKCDIYSLGRVAFELLTGQLPDKKPAAQLPSSLGSKAINAITDALRDDPQRRPSTVSEFIAEFEPGPIRAAPQPDHRWKTVSALLAGSLVIGGLLFWVSTSSQRQAFSTPIPLVTTPGFEYQPSFSPDGKWVFYAGGSEGRFDIFKKELAGGEPIRIVDNPNSDFGPHCSPDGKTLGFIRAYPTQSALVLKSLDPLGPDREIALSNDFDSFTWTPRGNSLLISEEYANSRRLAVLTLSSGEKREFIPTPVGTSGDIRPAFSPNGKQVAFIRKWDQGSADIFIADVDGSLNVLRAPHQITHNRDRIECVQWTPDGKDLLFVAGPLLHGSIWRISADGGTASQVPVGAARIETLAIAPNEWKLAYGLLLSDTNIWRLRLDSPPTSQLVIAGTYEDREAHLSPDETKIAFVSARSGEEQAWLAERDGTNYRKMTSFENADSVDVTWQRDSSTILVSVRSKALGRRIYRVSATGAQGPTELLDDGLASSVSRDGRFVYFCRRRDREWQLFRADLSAPSHVEQMTTAGGYYGIESLDGRSLYFTKQSEEEGIWRMDLPSGRPSRVVDSLYRRDLFVPSSEGLYFLGEGEQPSRPALFFKPRYGAAAKQIHSFDRDIFWGLDLFPDERSLLFSQYDVSNSDIMLVESFR